MCRRPPIPRKKPPMSAQPLGNVLFITIDQWRAECLSLLGHPCLKTPHLDATAADGVIFRNHFVQCSPCGPSRASLYTGQYMQNHRSVINGTPLDTRHTNVALEARAVGYSPLLFGYTDTSPDPRTLTADDPRLRTFEGVLPGFDARLELGYFDHSTWLDHLRTKGYAVPDGQWRIYDPVSNYPGAAERGPTYAPPIYGAEDSQTAFLTDAVLEELSAAGDAPWFIHASYLRPHPPMVAPEPYNALYDPADTPPPVRAASADDEARQHPWLAREIALLHELGDWTVQPAPGVDYDRDLAQIRATYYGLISKIDDAVGRIVAHLKDIGAYDNTLIVVTSDHGEMLGDHWLFAKRGYFDEAFQVPLIVRDPRADANATRGTAVDAFSESIDIMPTILDWIGRETPRQCDGYSVLPFCHGSPPAAWRTEVHWEYDFRDVAGGGPEGDLGLAMDQCNLAVIRDENYKYVHFHGLPPLFFDRRDDPAELIDRAGDPAYAGLVRDYAQKMLTWRMANDDRRLTGIQLTPAGPVSRDDRRPL
jgi:arylsulfatase A-like enzyme